MAETQALQERWQAELDRFLEPFLPCLHHENQRHWAPVYLRGLLGPGERKSMTRICDQVAPGEDDQINNFIAVAPWDIEAVQRVLAQVALAFLQSLRLAEIKKGTLRQPSRRATHKQVHPPSPRCRRCAGPLSSMAG